MRRACLINPDSTNPSDKPGGSLPVSIGDKLGPYETLAPIGAGGMGEVWKARDPRLNRFVAIKVLKGEHNSRFQQEARFIAALNHPHICTISDPITL